MIDPDALLIELRKLADAIPPEEKYTYAYGDSGDAHTDALKLATKFRELDDWLKGGGYLPLAWYGMPKDNDDPGEDEPIS